MTYRQLAMASTVALATTLWATHDFWRALLGFGVGMAIATWWKS